MRFLWRRVFESFTQLELKDIDSVDDSAERGGGAGLLLNFYREKALMRSFDIQTSSNIDIINI